MTFIELWPLTIDQLSAAVALDQRCLGGLWTLEGYRRELESPNSELLALRHPEPPNVLIGLGCYWAILEEAHITLLAIDPHYQQQGLGQALLWALLHSAHQRGLERATLEVREANQAARSLYQKFGFREAGRRRRYYPDTGEDALVLWQGGLQTAKFADCLQRWEQPVRERLERSSWQLTCPGKVPDKDIVKKANLT